MKRVSFAVLAVAAALYGCATTESQDSSERGHALAERQPVGEHVDRQPER